MKLFAVVILASGFAVQATRAEEPHRELGAREHGRGTLNIAVVATYSTGHVEGPRKQPFGNDGAKTYELLI
jgi:hypothetical protein